MLTSIGGSQFNVSPEPADFWGWVSEGRYNREWQILHRCLRPDQTFLDLGAWVGSHSLYASAIAQRVVAVEPDPVAFDILSANVALNGNKITPLRTAVTGYEGVITLGSGFLGASTTRANKNAGGGIGAWEEGHQFEIPCTTLRTFVESLDIHGPLFLKMDVEGSEEQILQDTAFFQEYKPTLYLEAHPFWWSDQQVAWENIRAIGKLYKHVLDLRFNPANLQTCPRELIFTDQGT